MYDLIVTLIAKPSINECKHPQFVFSSKNILWVSIVLIELFTRFGCPKLVDPQSSELVLYMESTFAEMPHSLIIYNHTKTYKSGMNQLCSTYQSMNFARFTLLLFPWYFFPEILHTIKRILVCIWAKMFCFRSLRRLIYFFYVRSNVHQILFELSTSFVIFNQLESKLFVLFCFELDFCGL